MHVEKKTFGIYRADLSLLYEEWPLLSIQNAWIVEGIAAAVPHKIQNGF